MPDLYRPEVSAHQRQRLHGEVVLAVPLPHMVLTGLLTSVGIAALLFACLVVYASRETVEGWLTPTGGLVRITAPRSGTLEQLFVDEDDAVRVRQAVARLRIGQETPKGALGERLAGAVADEDRAAVARQAAELSRLAGERARLAVQRAGLLLERRELDLRVATQVQQVALAREAVDRAEQVAKQGFFPMTQFQARRATLLSAQEYLGELRGALLAKDRELTDVDAQLEALPDQARRIEAEIAAQRAGIAQRRVGAEAQDVETLAAPVAGRVLALPSQVGQAVETGDAVALISAQDAPLEAELFVPSRAAGFVRPGQEVRLKYAAFPYQRFGAGQGVVRTVSRTVMPPAEATAAGLKIDEPVFRVRVALRRQGVSAYGQMIPLQPGMLLSADIVTDRRRLIEWVIDPIRAAAGA